MSNQTQVENLKSTVLFIKIIEQKTFMFDKISKTLTWKINKRLDTGQVDLTITMLRLHHEKNYNFGQIPNLPAALLKEKERDMASPISENW